MIADRAVFITVGKLIASGAVPYRDVYDHKQPMIHLLSALAWTVSPSVRAVFRMEQIALLLLAAAMFAMLRVAFGFRLIASLVGLSLGLIILRNPLVLEGGHLTEEYGILFLMVTVTCWALAVRRADGHGWLPWACGAGAAAALTLLTRESFVLALAVLAGSLHLPLRSDRSRLTRLLAWEVSGFALPLALWLLYLWRNEAVGAYLEVFADNFAYGGGLRVVGLAGALATGLETMVQIVFGNRPVIAVATGIAAVGALVATSWRTPPGHVAVRYLPMMVALWFGAELVAASAPGRFYGHYYIAFVPVAACAFAVIVEAVLPRTPTMTGAAAGRVAACATLVLISGWAMDRPFRAVADRPWAMWGFPLAGPLPDTVVEQLRADAARFDWRSYVPLAGNGRAVGLQMPLPLGTRFLYQFAWLFPSADSLRTAELLEDLSQTDVVVLDRSRPALPRDVETEIQRVLRSDFQPYLTADAFALFSRRRRAVGPP